MTEHPLLLLIEEAFRKLGDAEKLRQFGSLLKCYQEEVDNLTRRSKSAENAYLSVYRGLANIADPTIAIQAAISAEASNKGKNHTKLEIQNQKLQNELEEFRREFQDIKNQEVVKIQFSFCILSFTSVL